MDLNTLWFILVGVVLFIFGIENFSSEIQRGAGSWLNNILKKATKNRWYGAFFGFLTTALVNSSTATTLIAVGLVNAGLISFAQSLPLIFGANIGSTITAQLIAFKITRYAFIFLIFGFVLSFFRKTKFVGKSLFYFGLVFFAFNLISEAVAPFSKDPEVIKIFYSYNNFYLLILIGFLFTAIVNSSALTLGTIIVLAFNGFFGLNEAFPLILGANLGTTLTSFVASFRMDLHAKRVAFSHILFNVLGVFLIIPFSMPFLKFIVFLGGDIGRQVANAHLFFNLFVALFFLFLLNPFKRIIEVLVRGNEEEIVLTPKYLTGEKIPEKKSEVFSLVEKELKYAMEINEKILIYSKEYLTKGEEKTLRKLEKLCRLSNVVTSKIGETLFKFSVRKLTDEEAKKVLYLIRLVNASEQLGDLAGDLAFLPEKLREKNLPQRADIKKISLLFDLSIDLLKKINSGFPRGLDKKEFNRLHSDKIVKLLDKQYSSNIDELKKEDYSEGSFFVEASSILEEILFKIREITLLCNDLSKLE
ncbi:MAG: Na/Pi symporter [Candidatus Pacearchaeota archaeon]